MLLGHAGPLQCELCACATKSHCACGLLFRPFLMLWRAPRNNPQNWVLQATTMRRRLLHSLAGPGT